MDRKGGLPVTSRQRVLAVLNHEIPDRIPNAWGGCETAGLHVLAYQKLMKILGVPDAKLRVGTFMFNAVVPPEALYAMQGDVLLLASPTMCAKPLYGPDEDWKKFRMFNTDVYLTNNHDVKRRDDGYTYLSINGTAFARSPEDGYYFDTLPQGDMLDDEDMPEPSKLNYRAQTNDEKLRALEETARRLYEDTEYALVCGEAIRDLQLMPGGMLNWYDAMLNEPDLAGEYLSRAAEGGIEDLKVVHQAVGKYCSMLSIAHDLGDRRGVTIGPELFRQVYKPHYKRLFTAWHEITGMRINMHSCGSVSDVLGDLVECGLDVFNPVQISCDRMNPADLKARFGKDLVFFGGAYDAVNTPPGTPAEQVYRATCENIRALSKGGGYLFAGVHNTPADTPEEHLRAILRAYMDVRGEV